MTEFDSTAMLLTCMLILLLIYALCLTAGAISCHKDDKPKQPRPRYRVRPIRQHEQIDDHNSYISANMYAIQIRSIFGIWVTHSTHKSSAMARIQVQQLAKEYQSSKGGKSILFDETGKEI